MLSGLRRCTLALGLFATASACLAQGASVAASAPSSVLAAAAVPGAAASISRVGAGGDTLHLAVGHSIFLNTRFRLRKVYVADPTILNSFTLSPNQIVVTAMLPGTSSLVLLDEEGQAQSYVISSDLDVDSLRTAMSQALHDDGVRVDGSGSRVLLSGNVDSEAHAEAAVKLAALYSKDVANSMTVVQQRAKQVRLQVKILEVDRSKLTQFGINLFQPLGTNSFGGATTGQFPSTMTGTQGTTTTTATAAGIVTSGSPSTVAVSNPLNFLLYDWKYNIGATIQDLQTKQVLQILAEPTITAISGQKGSFLAGGEFPFPVIQPGGSSGSSASVTIQFRPYGVKLEFTPVVNEDGTIRLKVAPEVSALDYANSVTISGYTIPAIATRKAETEVELRSNQSFAISGLLDRRTTDSYSRTPGIASIPIIGELFKSKSLNHTNTELIVIVTPTIVDPVTDGADPKIPVLPVNTLNVKKFDKAFGDKPDAGSPNPPVVPSRSTASVDFAPATPSSPPADTSVAGLSSSVSSAAGAQAPTGASDAIVVIPVSTTSTTVNPPGAIPAAQAVSVEPSAQATTAPYAEPAMAMNSAPAARTANVSLPQARPISSPAVQDVTPPSLPDPEPQRPAVVQIMALSHREDADTMVSALKRQGYNAAIRQDPRDSLLHLQVGPFTSKDDAEAMRRKLLADGYNATVQ